MASDVSDLFSKMTLPSDFEIPYCDVNLTLDFLQDYQWLFNFRNTHIFVENVLDNFPEDWLEFLEKLSLPEFQSIAQNCPLNAPHTLRIFLDRLRRITPKLEVFDNPSETLPKNFHVSPKKAVEILSLGPFIHKLCRKYNTRVVIDVGAGHGMLAHFLHVEYGYKVLAIECDEGRYKKALFLQEKDHPKSQASVKFFHHFINEHSASAIENALKAAFPEEEGQPVIVTGLHACASLSATILSTFLQIEQAVSLAVIPCCYHRMGRIFLDNPDGEYFGCFPISEVLRNSYGMVNGHRFLRTPFLRLACQSSLATWKESTEEQLELVAQNCTYRAVLQDTVEKENLVLIRKHRKTGQTKKPAGRPFDFFDYAETIDEKFTVCPKPERTEPFNLETFKVKLCHSWRDYRDKIPAVKFLNAFQTIIQSVCESLIIQDRIQWLQEHDVNSYVEKVVGEGMSPRCYAIVGLKEYLPTTPTCENPYSAAGITVLT